MPATADLERARGYVEPYLNDCLINSSIADIDLTIRYIPIVMPRDMHYRYKERSASRIKQRIYDCAPYLDYDLFVSGNFYAQIKEYLRGIETSIPHLRKFGLEDKQIKEFSNILAGVLKSLSKCDPDQIRH